MFAQIFKVFFLFLFVLLFGLQGCSVFFTGLQKPKLNLLEEQIFYNFKAINLETQDTVEVVSENDQLIFINFWSTFCRPCIKELPIINALQKEEKSNCQFFLIGLDTPERQEKFLKNKGFSFSPYYLTEAGYPKNLETKIIPTTYLLKGDKVILRHEGSANWNVEEVKRLINRYK